MSSQRLPRRRIIQSVPLLATTLVGRGAAARDVIRVGMIPDAGATQVSVEQKAPLRDYLAKAIGETVELIIPTNYNATVEGLGNDSLDFAYLGGLTYIKAHVRYGVLPIVQRESDRQFHALFISHAGTDIKSLKDLKGHSFAFGDINSTSGHLMPYAEMLHAGISPDKDLQFRYTGSHPATAKAVEAGVVDAGAVDESVFHAMVQAGQLDKTKVYVFSTTAPFVDYVWVARKEIDAAARDRFAAAFLALQSPRDDKVLAILRGTKFVRANDFEYDPLRSVAKAVKLF
jgi:phosphonate transport system substrate-binding protein